MRFPAWFGFLYSTAAFAQTPDVSAWTAEIASRYYVVPNATYATINNYEAKLDVYVPRAAGAEARVPAVIFIHGGGWEGGDKATGVLRLMPYLEMGWAAVNVEYRGSRAPGGLAPAAVEDCRCALRWVIRNAARFNIDVSTLVLTGESAGSHLALITGMLPASAGMDTQCPGAEELTVAAIVNWYGVTDVADVVAGPNERGFAVRWFGDQPHRAELARRVSPLSYIRSGLPAVLTIHGDADPVAPYNHAVRLHRALDQAGVPNQLVTITGGDHGGFSREQFVRSYSAIREFLLRQGIASP